MRAATTIWLGAILVVKAVRPWNLKKNEYQLKKYIIASSNRALFQ